MGRKIGRVKRGEWWLLRNGSLGGYRYGYQYAGNSFVLCLREKASSWVHKHSAIRARDMAIRCGLDVYLVHVKSKLVVYSRKPKGKRR